MNLPAVAEVGRTIIGLGARIGCAGAGIVFVRLPDQSIPEAWETEAKFTW